MRLLFIIESLESGGAQRQIVNLAIELVRRSHEVELFCYFPQYDHFAPVLRNSAIPVHYCSKNSRFSVRPILALRRLIRDGNYDVALAFLPTPSFYAEIASVGKALPLVVSERFMYINDTLSVGHWLLQQTHRLADHISVNSHHQRLRMVREFPWMSGKISTIYNGVDLERFSPATTVSPSSKEGLRLLVLSSVVPKKNSFGLVRALATYTAKYAQPCTVSWAGKVFHTDSSQREFQETNRLIFELGLSHQWEWLGVQTNIPELLHSHDALIHPSFYEGLPNAICEALACGRPVLASNTCDNPTLVQHRTTGFLFDPGDANDMAQAIRELFLMSTEDRLAMGKKARIFAERELSLEKYCNQYEDLFEHLHERYHHNKRDHCNKVLP